MTSPCPLDASAPTNPCGQNEGYVLTKVSKGGIQYFYTGGCEDVETLLGAAVVANCSLFPGEAYVFRNKFHASSDADRLNESGIGGADWIAVSVANPIVQLEALS